MLFLHVFSILFIKATKIIHNRELISGESLGKYQNQLPFEYKKIISPQTRSNAFFLEKYRSDEIMLRTSGAYVAINDSFTFFTYDEFSEIIIDITDNYLTIESHPDAEDFLDEKMNKIIPSIYSEGRMVIFFSKFSDPKLVANYSKKFHSSDVHLWYKINNEYPFNCLWDYDTDYPDEYLTLVSTTDWKMVCVGHISMLHISNNDIPNKGKIVYISLGAAIGIACAIIIVIILITLSLCFIAYRRYIKHFDKSDDEMDNAGNEYY